MRRLAFEVISQSETKSAQRRKPREKERKREEKIMHSLMATSLRWRTNSARTNFTTQTTTWRRPPCALLGMLLFFVLINDVGFDDQLKNVGDVITCKRRIKEYNQLHLKYVDDLTIAEAVDMKSQPKSLPIEERPHPDSFHDRTGHCLKPEDSKVNYSRKLCKRKWHEIQSQKD